MQATSNTFKNTHKATGLSLLQALAYCEGMRVVVGCQRSPWEVRSPPIPGLSVGLIHDKKTESL